MNLKGQGGGTLAGRALSLDGSAPELQEKGEKDFPIMLIDTHAHLDFPEFSEDIPSVLKRAAEVSVSRIITIGIDLPSSSKAVKLAQSYVELFATVGIHPHEAKQLDEATLSTLRGFVHEERVVAVGEIGLDYYRDWQPREIQRECFRQQLELACAEAMVAVFHIRDAYEDFFSIVRDYAGRLPGAVMHCFSGDWAIAEQCLELGFFLSIPGTVTFPKSQVQQDVARRAPLERLLVETDAPYLTPVPHRGKNNEPSFVKYTAQKIADLRGCSLEEVAERTTRNARFVFRLDRWEALGTESGNP